MAMDIETIDIVVKGAIGLIVVTGFHRFLKKMDSLEDAIKSVRESLSGLSESVKANERHQSNNERLWNTTFKRFDRLIEMLRKRDHKFVNILQEIRLQGETKANWTFKVNLDMPGPYDDKDDKIEE